MEQRFLQENVILVGVIPGPREPQFDINSFLKPLVDDLLLLWNGVLMDTIMYFFFMVMLWVFCVQSC